MKIHIITVGEPKLDYAKDGWDLYTKRLARYHTLRTTSVPDKRAYDSNYLLERAGDAYKIVLDVLGKSLDSAALAKLLDEHAQYGRELCFMIGGPEGLPREVIDRADLRLSLSSLTFPHDLAMVVTAEALYRASTINAGHPYHK